MTKIISRASKLYGGHTFVDTLDLLNLEVSYLHPHMRLQHAPFSCSKIDRKCYIIYGTPPLLRHYC